MNSEISHFKVLSTVFLSCIHSLRPSNLSFSDFSIVDHYAHLTRAEPHSTHLPLEMPPVAFRWPLVIFAPAGAEIARKPQVSQATFDKFPVCGKPDSRPGQAGRPIPLCGSGSTTLTRAPRWTTSCTFVHTASLGNADRFAFVPIGYLGRPASLGQIARGRGVRLPGDPFHPAPVKGWKVCQARSQSLAPGRRLPNGHRVRRDKRLTKSGGPSVPWFDGRRAPSRCASKLAELLSPPSASSDLLEELLGRHVGLKNA